MPTAYNSSVARAELRGTYFGEEVMNVLWFQSLAIPVTQGMLGNLGSALAQWWRDNLRLVQSNNYVLREVYVASWANATAPTATESLFPAEPGLNLQEGVPGSVALCVTFRTAGRGRSSRGRNYVAGLTENVLQGNNWTQTITDSVVSAYFALQPAVSVEGWEHVVYSQFTSNTLRPVGQAAAVTSVTADTRVDSMRRRLAGRGR